MKTFKSFALATVLSSPFLFPTAASANMQKPLVDQQAVSLLTTSLKQTVAAYDTLTTGNKFEARANLDKAVQKLTQAVSKDPTLGVSYQNGQALTAKQLHQELKTVQQHMSAGKIADAQSNLTRVLNQAGVI